MTLEEIGLQLVKKADYIGCVHSTQGNGLPTLNEVITDLKRQILELDKISSTDRHNTLVFLGGSVLFALFLENEGK